MHYNHGKNPKWYNTDGEKEDRGPNGDVFIENLNQQKIKVFLTMEGYTIH